MTLDPESAYRFGYQPNLTPMDYILTLLFIKDQGANRFTPWFLLMSQSMLPKWWDNIGDLKAFIDEENIIKY